MQRELRFGARTLLESPVFTLVAVATLALGIGLTSAIFSIFQAVTVDGLPFEQGDRLVFASGTLSPGSKASDVPFSYQEIVDFRASTEGFQGFAGYSKATPFNLSYQGQADNVAVELVSEDYFSVLGADAELGRLFSAREHAVGSGDKVVILGHSLWQSRFGGQDSILRQSIHLGGQAYEVVGVMGPGFEGLGGDAAAWLPVTRAATILAPKYVESRAFGWLGAVARLDDGQSLEQARAAVASVVAGLAAEYPDVYRDFGVRVELLADERLGDLNRPLTLLLLASLFVLLIVCTNIANLLLARAAARQQELSLRKALGASRLDLVRLMLAESLLLALAGGIGGLALAHLGTGALLRASGARLPAFADVRVDVRVVAATLAVALLCGLVFGLVGAYRAIRSTREFSLEKGGRSGSPGRHHARLQSALVIGQVAATLVLLIATGVLYDGFRSLRATELGFEAENVHTARVYYLEPRFADDEAVWSWIRPTLERLSALPGVRSAAMASPSLPTDNYTAYYGVVEDHPDTLTEKPAIMLPHFVSADYFSTLGIPLVAGRPFTDADTHTSAGVIVVSRSMAEHYWPGEDPLGKRLKIRRRGHEERPWLSVVGVAEDLRHQGLSAATRPGHDVYVPILRILSRDPPKINLLLETEGALDAQALASAVAGELKSVDAGLPAYDYATLEQRLGGQMSSNRLEIFLFGLLALVALVLAAVGLYGLMSYSVGQRKSELAICMALGADSWEVARSVLVRGARLTLWGIGIGLVIGLLAMPRILDSLLYESGDSDLWLAIAASLLLLLVGLAASFVPARRATRVLPAVVLRGDD